MKCRNELIKFFLVFAFFVKNQALANKVTPVKINAVAALSATDSDYSERFKYVYEESLKRAIEAENIKLKQCGYQLFSSSVFYSGGDPMGPVDAIRKAQENDPWLLIGPDKSSEFVIAARGRKTSVPIVSTMAGSIELNELDEAVFSAVPLVDEMANVAVLAVVAQNFGKTFATVLDPTCLFCRDFANFFEAAAVASGMKKLFQVQITSEAPLLDELQHKLIHEKPHFFLLPGYSKQSGLIMAEIAKSLPISKFVGADGWGDGEFGYLTKYPLGARQEGISIRPGRPLPNMLKQINVPLSGMQWKGNAVKPPFTSFALIEIVQKAAQVLCLEKPKSSAEFRQLILRKSKSYFHTKSGLSIYRLKNRKLAYDRPAK